jgi:hypothetical protein
MRIISLVARVGMVGTAERFTQDKSARLSLYARADNSLFFIVDKA